eukprot:maker-scaffold_9-snap-gene-12.47-mRNA-1 protein AED:0.37 eAED:0.37 QI:84/0.8/0.66/0.83/1/1/6/0/1028
MKMRMMTNYFGLFALICAIVFISTQLPNYMKIKTDTAEATQHLLEKQVDFEDTNENKEVEKTVADEFQISKESETKTFDNRSEQNETISVRNESTAEEKVEVFDFPIQIKYPPFDKENNPLAKKTCWDESRDWKNRGCFSDYCMTYFADFSDIERYNSCSFVIGQFELSTSFLKELEEKKRSIGVFTKPYCLKYSCEGFHDKEKETCLQNNGYMGLSSMPIIFDHKKCINYSGIQNMHHVTLERYKTDDGNKPYTFSKEFNALLPTPYTQYSNPSIPKFVYNAENHPVLITGYSGLTRSLITGEVYLSKKASYVKGFDTRRAKVKGRRLSETIDFSSCFKEGKFSCENCDSSKVRNSKGPIQCYKKVIVLAQPMGFAVYHFLVEGLPRIAPFLLTKESKGVLDPSVKFHVAANKTIVKRSLEYFLKINPNQIVFDDVIAENVLLLAPGADHDPLQSFFELELWKKYADSKLFSSKLPTRVSRSEEVFKIMVLKRQVTRLSYFSASMYDNLVLELEKRFTGMISQKKVVVSLYDDSNKTLMGSMHEQLASFRDKDLIIGAHGAGFSHLTFMKEGSYAISLKYTSNSDIYSHMAFITGVNFVNVLYRKNFGLALEEISQVATDIVKKEVFNNLGKILFVKVISRKQERTSSLWETLISFKGKEEFASLLLLIDETVSKQEEELKAFAQFHQVENIIILIFNKETCLKGFADYVESFSTPSVSSSESQSSLLTEKKTEKLLLMFYIVNYLRANKQTIEYTNTHSHISFLDSGTNNFYLGNFTKFISQNTILAKDLIITTRSDCFFSGQVDSTRLGRLQICDEDPLFILRMSDILFSVLTGLIQKLRTRQISLGSDLFHELLNTKPSRKDRFSFLITFLPRLEKSSKVYKVQRAGSDGLFVKAASTFKFHTSKLNIPEQVFDRLVFLDQRTIPQMYYSLFHHGDPIDNSENILSSTFLNETYGEVLEYIHIVTRVERDAYERISLQFDEQLFRGDEMILRYVLNNVPVIEVPFLMVENAGINLLHQSLDFVN